MVDSLIDDVPLIRTHEDGTNYSNPAGTYDNHGNTIATEREVDDELLNDHNSNGQAAANTPLTNDDDVRLIDAGISEYEAEFQRNIRHRRNSTGSRLKPTAFAHSNFASASCNAIVVVIAITALVEPSWFTFAGDTCQSFASGDIIHYIGPHLFFNPRGEFMRYTVPSNYTHYLSDNKPYSMYRYDSSVRHVLVNCVDRSSVDIIRLLIVLVIIVALLSLVQAVLDILGTKASFLYPLASNSVFSIFAVTLCAVSQAVCYWLTRLLEHVARLSRKLPPSNVPTKPIEVSFSVGFYLLTVCACLSILATGFNLLLIPDKNRRHRNRPRRHIEAIDFGPEYGPDVYDHDEAPPPPYTP